MSCYASTNTYHMFNKWIMQHRSKWSVILQCGVLCIWGQLHLRNVSAEN